MSLSNITPTTELEALNAVLKSIGEAPVDLLESEQPDVQTSLLALREATREVQSGNWRFNTQHAYRLSPSGTFSWDGTELNVFTPPENAMRVEPSPLNADGSPSTLNVVLRQAERFTAGDPPVRPLVLFDLTEGRDGFPTTGIGARSELRLDIVWAFDFAGMPEAVRRYVVIVASRRTAGLVLGNPDRSGRIARDEAAAWREVVRSQRPKSGARILTDREEFAALGGRPDRSLF